MARQPKFEGLVEDLEAFARDGAGYWHIRAVPLPVIEALPSVVQAAQINSAARGPAIEAALVAACAKIEFAPWRDAARDELGLSEKARQLRSRTERRKLAAQKIPMSEKSYRETRKRPDGTYEPFRDGRYISWSAKTIALVAEALLLAEFGPMQPDQSSDGDGDGVGLAFAGVQGHHIELFRVTEDGRVEHRWHPDEDRDDKGWSAWHDFGFRHSARDVAAVSAWPGHLEVFVLDADGGVWNRAWWRDTGWNDFDFLGNPFGSDAVNGIAAASMWEGHIDVQVRSADGALRNNWFDGTRWEVPKHEPCWRSMG